MVIAMDMIGKVRRLRLRKKHTISEIAKVVARDIANAKG